MARVPQQPSTCHLEYRNYVLIHLSTLIFQTISRFACGIEVTGEDNNFVVSGGDDSLGKAVKTVRKYTEFGNDWKTRSYPDLNQGRRNHACSMFRGDNGDTVSI